MAGASGLGEQEQVGVHGQVPGVRGAGRSLGGGVRYRKAEQPVLTEEGVHGDEVLDVHEPCGARLRDQLAGPAGPPDHGGDDGEQAAGAPMITARAAALV
jgi:hypothetical protein